MRTAIIHLKRNDPTMREIIERVGPFRMQFREPSFDTLVRSIVYQQISGKVAKVLYQRLLDAAGGDGLTPESLLRLAPARMRKLGMSRQKIAYLRDLARRTRAGHLVLETIGQHADGEVIELLTAVKGIGVWTAQMFLMFALRRPDVLPTGDLGIREAMRRAYALAELPKPGEMEEIARKWRPYCSVACWYLWRSLDGPAGV